MVLQRKPKTIQILDSNSCPATTGLDDDKVEIKVERSTS